MGLKYFVAVLLLCLNEGFLIDHDAPRKVVKVLTAGNGGHWGEWHPPHYCAEGAYAVGFNLKIESYQQGLDDTALNAILLKCETLDGPHYAGYIESGEGQWGSWIGEKQCQNVNQTRLFLNAFSLQVEPNQHGLDDTAANWARFKCREFAHEVDFDLDIPPGHGKFGTYGGWSESCPLNSAICGIQSRIEGAQGAGDDTAMNDAKFFCCSE
ncbi:vitelline membrane outer layer protein 1-like [Mytilus edulis]|uniref:vitelline membrane outer layer protein 1-like n=1 Tax=Mytilus edulis TaxID=6550 RepID=UPI0039EE4187